MQDPIIASVTNNVLQNPNPCNVQSNVSEKNSSQYWDPDGTKIAKDFAELDRKKLEEKYEKYKQNPRIPLRNLLLSLIPLVATIVILIFFPQILGNSNIDLRLLILPIVLPAGYIYYIHGLQCDLIKMMIAQEHNWLYAPEKNYQHWTTLKIKFAEFFNKGDSGQAMEDEFWGKFKNAKFEMNFYSSLFEYETTTHDSKGRRHKQKHEKTVFAFGLNKKLKTDFRLEPEGIILKLFNIFRSKEINTESTEFNKSFAVFYNGQKMEKELDIVKTLSPAVQIKLLELKKEKGCFSIMFRDDTVIVVFDKNLFKKMYTSFFKKIELDPRDKENISKIINDILEISCETVQYLD